MTINFRRTDEGFKLRLNVCDDCIEGSAFGPRFSKGMDEFLASKFLLRAVGLGDKNPHVLLSLNEGDRDIPAVERKSDRRIFSLGGGRYFEFGWSQDLGTDGEGIGAHGKRYSYFRGTPRPRRHTGPKLVTGARKVEGSSIGVELRIRAMMEAAK